MLKQFKFNGGFQSHTQIAGLDYIAGHFAKQGAILRLDYAEKTYGLIQMKELAEITRVLSTGSEGAQSKLFGAATDYQGAQCFWKLELN